MRKIYTILLSVFFCAATAVAQETIITQPADGETINLYRTTTGFESVYYYGIPHKSTGDWLLVTMVQYILKIRSIHFIQKRG